LWDSYWDITATTHVLHFENYDETYDQAAQRVLSSEMGISNVVVENIGGFNYFAKHGKNCENEYCAILLGRYDGKVIPDKNAVYEFKWMDKNEFITMCLNNQSDYTPWAVLTGKFLAKKL
jgi:isopentenyl-diphosphate delta-isomerase